MKQGGDFFRIWGGIAGVQSTLNVLLERVPDLIPRLLARTPAGRFRIPKKGRIAVGFDADLVLVDRSAEFELKAEDLLQCHPINPYIGHRFRGTVRETFIRGVEAERARGRFVRPCDT
jgi:allantoinase